MLKVTDESRLRRTSCQGYLWTTYAELVTRFGETSRKGSPDRKCQAEWWLQAADGMYLANYDYREAVSPDRVTCWHIGGRSRAVVHWVDMAFPGLTRAQ